MHCSPHSLAARGKGVAGMVVGLGLVNDREKDRQGNGLAVKEDIVDAVEEDIDPGEEDSLAGVAGEGCNSFETEGTGNPADAEDIAGVAARHRIAVEADHVGLRYSSLDSTS